MKKEWQQFIPSCVAGNIIELYEFMIYGYFAPIIGELFFPKSDPDMALLATFAVLASGCLVRPFSAILLGYWGDRLGRRFSLIFSITTMSIATLGIGCLPTYQTLGAAAPLCLLICKILQGLSMTGEETAATLFLVESAPANEKGFASALTLSSVYLGLLAGSIVAAFIYYIFPHSLLMVIGWRIPFMLGGIAGFVTLFYRIKQPESPEFLHALKQRNLSENPLATLGQHFKLTVLKSAALFCLYCVAVYLYAVYIPAFFGNHGVHEYQVLLICSIGFLFTAYISLQVGKIIDQIGYQLPIIISIVGFFLVAYPTFYLLTLHTIMAMLAAYAIFTIFIGILAGSMMMALVNQFPIAVKFSGSCIAFNIGMSVFGGITPLLAIYLTKILHSEIAPAYLLMVAALISLGAILMDKKIIGETYYDDSVRC